MKELLLRVDGVLKVSNLADPIGKRQLHRELDENLILERVTVPLGVLGVIFESRPDALIQIASLAVRSGNGALLKGGSEAKDTNQAIMDSLDKGLRKSNVGSGALSLLTTRQESLGLLRLDRFVNLIIPRGSNELVQFIQENTRIPVLGHGASIPGNLQINFNKDGDFNDLNLNRLLRSFKIGSDVNTATSGRISS